MNQWEDLDKPPPIVTAGWFAWWFRIAPISGSAGFKYA